jgi:hypothetical protein
MRHLMVLAECRLPLAVDTLVELGPGETLGISLMALLTGTRRIIALDVAPHAWPDANRAVFAELVELVRSGAAVPDNDEFPLVRPLLPRLLPATELVAPDVLARALDPERLREIERALAAPGNDASAPVRYVCPWDIGSVQRGAADMVVSQAVLQYIPHEPGNDRLDDAFRAMRHWLPPGGVFSHQIDFTGPFGPEWNAHWTVSNTLWRVIRGKRVMENRAPLSAYLTLCERHGFELLANIRTPAESGVARPRLAPGLRDLPEEDYSTVGVHLVARRR